MARLSTWKLVKGENWHPPLARRPYHLQGLWAQFPGVSPQASRFRPCHNTCSTLTLTVPSGGLQTVAGTLFFWSYELLVFMVLLNFLLAIIVDAFSEVGRP